MSFLVEAPSKDPIVVQPGEGKTFIVMEDKLTCKIAGEDTGGAYTVLLSETEPQAATPLHVHHREDEVYYVLEGEFEIHCGDRMIKATVGSCVFGPRNIPHKFQNVGPGPGKILLLSSPAGVEKYFEEMSQSIEEDPSDTAKLEAISQKYGIELLNA